MSTQAEFDRLNAAINSGELEVTNENGSKVRYRSLDEMRRIARRISGELAAASGSTPRRRAMSVYTRKGVY